MLIKIPQEKTATLPVLSFPAFRVTLLMFDSVSNVKNAAQQLVPLVMYLLVAFGYF